MSTKYDQTTLIEALYSGADDFMGKPPRAEELYARLRAAERIASMQRELINLATTDPLTGLNNRRGFFERATEACARTIPDGKLAAIFLDIDNFKRINNAYGHDTGDEAIRACARAAWIENGVVGRLGGDEFALLLEERRLPEAVEIAEDLRARLADKPLVTEKGPITLTWSVGVSEAHPGDTVDCLLARADAALYDAKITGRNRVVARPGIIRSAPRARDAVASHAIAGASLL
ncbi:MAG: diguanylate cyclase [Methyloceanibacter sp.]|uniref:GGDEF domain-containing protein n=1 Tax=Methyloceanibacter sp. TaxID=1965321 RepID=UPI003D9B6819